MGHKATTQQCATYADREHTLYRMFKQGERDPQAVLDLIQSAIDGSAWPQPAAALVTGEYPLTVDRSQSIADLLKAGRYDYISADITDRHFSVEGGWAEVMAVMVHLNRVATDDEVLAAGERLGLRPATMAELIVLGASYPVLQLQYPIVALGAVWVGSTGSRNKGCLWRFGRERHVILSRREQNWHNNCRFLFVRK